LLWAAALALVAASATYALYQLFSSFRFYDDEGYLLLAVRYLLRGHRLYDEVSTPYGPFYFAYEYLLHAVLGIPLTHTATRWITLAHWLAVALLCALVVRRITGSTLWALVAYAASTLALRMLANEPGHPQELCALLVVAIPLVVRDERWSAQPGRLIALGVLSGLAAQVKVNVGLYCLAACATLLVRDAPRSALRTGLAALVAISAAIAPLLVMRSSLATPGCAAYAVVASIGIAAATIAVLGRSGGTRPVWRTGGWFAVGFAVASFASFAFVMARGSTIGGFVDALVVYARSHMDYPSMCPRRHLAHLPLAAGSCALALLAAWGLQRGRFVEGILVVAKAGFAVVALTNLPRLGPTQATLLALAPWTWLWAMAPATTPESRDRTAVRGAVALLAAWQVLLPYPVAGTQVAMGVFSVPSTPSRGWATACARRPVACAWPCSRVQWYWRSSSARSFAARASRGPPIGRTCRWRCPEPRASSSRSARWSSTGAWSPRSSRPTSSGRAGA
jgi:hypothetical protein